MVPILLQVALVGISPEPLTPRHYWTRIEASLW